MPISEEQAQRMHEERIHGLRLKYGDDHPEVVADDLAHGNIPTEEEVLAAEEPVAASELPAGPLPEDEED